MVSEETYIVLLLPHCSTTMGTRTNRLVTLSLHPLQFGDVFHVSRGPLSPSCGINNSDCCIVIVQGNEDSLLNNLVNVNLYNRGREQHSQFDTINVVSMCDF